MDDSIHPLLEDFTETMTDLERALQPIITTALSTSASTLPLLDKAKLYVLATYALESILFSFLRLNGQDAKNHTVYAELNRVKEYFAKIKTAEDIGAGGGTIQGKVRLDKGAAGRFIRAGLAGNEKYDQERKMRREREANGAKRKLEEMGVGTHTRFDGTAKRMRENEERVNVVRAKDADLDDSDKDEEGEVEVTQTQFSGKRKAQDQEDILSRLQQSLSSPATGEEKGEMKKKKKKRSRNKT